MTAAHTLRLVLGDQLHPGHSWFSQVDEQVVYVLMEVRQRPTTYCTTRRKNLAICRHATLRAICARAATACRYVALDDPANRQSIPGNLAALAAHYAAQRIEWQQPDNGGWTLTAGLGRRPAAGLGGDGQRAFLT